MKKALFLAFAPTGATTVLAQQATPPAGAPGPNFEQRKEQILKRMEARMQALQKAHDCVQQAQDENAARACRPERRERRYGGGRPDGGPK